MGKINMKYMPRPNKEYVAGFGDLSGGINTWDPAFGLRAKESPMMQNLLWRNGMLVSRGGQYFICDNATLGRGISAYPRLWHGFAFAHIGQSIYVFNALGAYVQLATGVPEIRGTFFLYGDKLYYKTSGAYKQIAAEETGQGWTFTCTSVYPYEPVILINAVPSTGSGDLYQPENRLSSRKTVWYNAVNGSRTYHLPVVANRVTYVEVDGVRLESGWSYDRQNGNVIFQTAPPVYDPPRNNTVHITYEMSNPDAQKSIMDCRYAATYGGTGEVCVVMAGAEEQVNAYFWSGNSDIKMDPSYFPMEQYQLAGSSDERITGFGKQQDNLIIFKEDSVGKTTLGTQVINNRVYIDMPFISINTAIGCDKPWSIQLVENNLVFANRRGVFMLQDTTAANENNIVPISRKVNENGIHSGLVDDLSVMNEDSVCSIDDGRCYYLVAHNKAWVWDYELSSYKDPSWFLFTNFGAVALVSEDGEIYHFNLQGQFSCLRPPCVPAESRLAPTGYYTDYGQPIERAYNFPVMTFGGSDARANINSVLIALGGFVTQNNSLMYMTEYGNRQEPTPLQVIPELTYEANRVPGTRPRQDFLTEVFRRRPMARRVLHFSMQIYNNNPNEDFELVSAQVFYNFQGRLR